MRDVLDAIFKLDGKVDDIRRDLAKTDAKVDDVRRDLAKTDAKVDSHRTETTRGFAAVDAKLDVFRDVVSSHRQDTRALEAEVTELRKDVDALKRRPARTPVRPARGR